MTQDFDGKYEIIIVDDVSNDATISFIKEKYSNIVKVISNRRKEDLAISKEKGVKIAKGDIIAFTDDDCVVSRNWLNNIKDSLVTYDFVGGIVFPLPGTNFPWWWRNSLDWLVGVNPKIGRRFLPLGSNIAFKRRVFEALKNSKKNIVRDPAGNMRYGEDTYRVQRVKDFGFSMMINNNMVVYHHILPERLRVSYLLKRSYIEGWVWAVREPEFKIFLLRIIAFIVNPFRFLISWNINNLFRMVVSVAYIWTFIKKEIGRCI